MLIIARTPAPPPFQAQSGGRRRFPRLKARRVWARARPPHGAKCHNSDRGACAPAPQGAEGGSENAPVCSKTARARAWCASIGSSLERALPVAQFPSCGGGGASPRRALWQAQSATTEACAHSGQYSLASVRSMSLSGIAVAARTCRPHSRMQKDPIFLRHFNAGLR